MELYENKTEKEKVLLLGVDTGKFNSDESINELSELVDVYVVLILFGIGIPAERFERLLLLFHPQQQVFDGRYQRQRPQAGFRLRCI